MSKNSWIHVASFYQHNGNTDDTGNPTYSNPADWVAVVTNWPCSNESGGSGEVIRGRQTAAETTRVLEGEYYGAAGIDPTMQCHIDGKVYGITRVGTPDGLARELRVEIGREYD